MGLETFARESASWVWSPSLPRFRHCNIPGHADVGQRKAIRMTTKEMAMSLTGVGTHSTDASLPSKVVGVLGGQSNRGKVL